jgi:hypothetical protein
MSLINWFRKQAAALSIAMANVEKTAFNQNGNKLEENISQERKFFQGTLAEALEQGEITQEVRDLRWRTYKVLLEQDKYTLEREPWVALDDLGNEIVDEFGNKVYARDENGDVIYNLVKVPKDFRRPLTNVMLDSADEYPAEMIIFNEVIKASIQETSENQEFTKYFSNNIHEKSVRIERKFVPKFEIENYTKKIVVRKISETEKLLEFYVSKYPDEHNFSTKMFINELVRVMKEGSRNINSLEIDSVGFITERAIGVPDFRLFTYDITSFDKIVEFDGNYVVKFKATPVIEDAIIFDKFLEEKLEEKYNNKEQKKITI